MALGCHQALLGARKVEHENVRTFKVVVNNLLLMEVSKTRSHLQEEINFRFHIYRENKKISLASFFQKNLPCYT